jgi:3-methyl-2-oxobutanoate hydroxymethyltransferase
MRAKRPTIADIRANKGKYRYTMMRVETWEELEAAEEAGIDMVSVPPEMLAVQHFRTVAPTLFAVPGLPLWANQGPTDDFLRWGYEMMRHGADAVYCAASINTINKMADEKIPVIGHVGLVPHFCTWTGGFKAVGKTASSAMSIFERCKLYEEAGAFGVEIEVVPPEVTEEISKQTSLFLVSMGGGAAGDCQYLFACDVLGTNTGHVPRHAKKYVDLNKEYSRIQSMRVEAFKAFSDEVRNGVYPSDPYVVKAQKSEMAEFRRLMKALPKKD